MLPSVKDPGHVSSSNPRRQRRRVLISGVASVQSIALVRSLAARGDRIVLHARATSDAVAALVADISAQNSLVSAWSGALEAPQTAMRFTADAAIVQGSLDLVVNVVPVALADFAESLGETEQLDTALEDVLGSAVAASHVAANRMGLTWRAGLVLNVVEIVPSGSPADTLLAALVGSGLAGATRALAERWADAGIAVNAIGPVAAEDAEADDTTGGDRLIAIVNELGARHAENAFSGLVFKPELAAV